MPPSIEKSEPLTPQETVEKYREELAKRRDKLPATSAQRRRWDQLYKETMKPGATTKSIWDAFRAQRRSVPKSERKSKLSLSQEQQQQQKELPEYVVNNLDQGPSPSTTPGQSNAMFKVKMYYMPQNTGHSSQGTASQINQSTKGSSQPLSEYLYPDAMSDIKTYYPPQHISHSAQGSTDHSTSRSNRQLAAPVRLDAMYRVTMYYMPQNNGHGAQESKGQSISGSSQRSASLVHTPHSTSLSSSTRGARSRSTSKPGVSVSATKPQIAHTQPTGDPPQRVNTLSIAGADKSSCHITSPHHIRRQHPGESNLAHGQISSTGPSAVQNSKKPVQVGVSTPSPMQGTYSQGSKAYNVKSTARASTPELHSSASKTILNSSRSTDGTRSYLPRRAMSKNMDMSEGTGIAWNAETDYESFTKSFNGIVESYNSYQNEMFERQRQAEWYR